MAVNYTVKIFCETCGEWKYNNQVDTVDNTWRPVECNGHIFTADSFCIDEKEVV